MSERYELAAALVKAAKFYHDEIADCTCADGDWECWYHLSDEAQACLSVAYALRTILPSADNPDDVEALARGMASQVWPWQWALFTDERQDTFRTDAAAALRWMENR